MGSVARHPTRLSQRPWPVILVTATLLVDVVAVFTGYVLMRIIGYDYFGFRGLFRPITFVTVTIWPVAFAISGLYQPGRLIHPNPAELLRLLAASVVVAFLVLLIGYLTRSDLPRFFIPVLLGSCLVNVVAGRIVTRSLALAVNEW
jgi:FlaA1/EpsC-like NDP-sugar epimerase